MFQGYHFWAWKLWKSKNSDLTGIFYTFRRKLDQMRSREARSGRSVLIFVRGIRFSRSRGPEQPKTGKSKNPGFRIFLPNLPSSNYNNNIIYPTISITIPLGIPTTPINRHRYHDATTSAVGRRRSAAPPASPSR